MEMKGQGDGYKEVKVTFGRPRMLRDTMLMNASNVKSQGAVGAAHIVESFQWYR